MPNTGLCPSAQGGLLAQADAPICLADGPCPFGCWWLCAQAPLPCFVPREQTLQGSAWSWESWRFWGSWGYRGSSCCRFSPASQVPCRCPGPEHPAAPRHWGVPLLAAVAGLVGAFWGQRWHRAVTATFCHLHLQGAVHVCRAGGHRAGPAHPVPTELCVPFQPRSSHPGEGRHLAEAGETQDTSPGASASWDHPNC